MTNVRSDCPHCGFTENDRSVSACRRCGFSLPTYAIRVHVPESTGWLCLDCPTRNLSNANFCDSCGSPLKRDCAHCGCHNRIAARVCRNCGVELKEQFQTEDTNFKGTFSQVHRDADVENDGLFEDVAFKASEGPSLELSEQSFRAYHSASLREYVQLWFDEELRHETDINAADAGYHVVLHAVQLFRFTAEAAVLAGLESWPLNERQLLMTAVGSYLGELTFTDTLRQLLVRDDLEPEDLEQLEDVLLARDGLEEVLRFLPQLAEGFSDSHHASFQQSLADATAHAAECDALLQGRPDVLSVLGEPLAALEEAFEQPVDQQRSWWFQLPKQLAQEYELRSWPSDVLGRLPQRGSNVEEPVGLVEELVRSPIASRPGTDVLREPSSLPMLALAAASETQSTKANYLSASQFPNFLWAVLSQASHFYQVLALHAETYERTSEWDGAKIVAWSTDGGQRSGWIEQGIAELQLTGPICGCRLCLADGREVVLEVQSV